MMGLKPNLTLSPLPNAKALGNRCIHGFEWGERGFNSIEKTSVNIPLLNITSELKYQFIKANKDNVSLKCAVTPPFRAGVWNWVKLGFSPINEFVSDYRI